MAAAVRRAARALLVAAMAVAHAMLVFACLLVLRAVLAIIAAAGTATVELDALASAGDTIAFAGAVA